MKDADGNVLIDSDGFAVVELWWCPVCGGAAHRTSRPGRPKLYCSNACRQRAYRWRRDHCARTVSMRDHRPPAAFVPMGRCHAMRTPVDFMASHSDRRRRRPTVCGVLARPRSDIPANCLHDRFFSSNSRACRTCVALTTLPLDALVTVEVRPPAPPLWLLSQEAAARAFLDALEPDHPLLRHDAALAMMLGPYAPRRAA